MHSTKAKPFTERKTAIALAARYDWERREFDELLAHVRRERVAVAERKAAILDRLSVEALIDLRRQKDRYGDMTATAMIHEQATALARLTGASYSDAVTAIAERVSREVSPSAKA